MSVNSWLNDEQQFADVSSTIRYAESLEMLGETSRGAMIFFSLFFSKRNLHKRAAHVFLQPTVRRYTLT